MQGLKNCIDVTPGDTFSSGLSSCGGMVGLGDLGGLSNLKS